ncbi:hypothetical protein G7Y89_g13142 [Cudoniella acicularis]|uniref:Heterokaryon incompatibility domain-containing protein n=1 Tax=Cudoniella acicularis TaxID=354080 RepID=A0A8H4RAG6_9HELO|nr:hypothetical protein G7Y89_g13142 [Cudoniella acicularis]
MSASATAGPSRAPRSSQQHSASLSTSPRRSLVEPLIDVEEDANFPQTTAADQLSSAEWCSSLVHRIRNEYSPATADFIFSLPQPNDIINVIDKGGIPLISLSLDLEGGLRIRVVRATATSKYFAVSHIWSDSLGNPNANTLPECQIRLLEGLGPSFRKSSGIQIVDPTTAEKLWKACISKDTQMTTGDSPETLLWIDTLCIPVDPEYSHLRTQAINSMAQIYASAGSIIILNHELLQLRRQEMPALSISAYVICSGWMSRCWTFQEGPLANKWLVLFEDGVVCIDDLFESIRHRPNSSSPVPSESDLFSWYRNMPRLRELYEQRTFSRYSYSSQTLPLRHIWNNLCTRTTTKREDLISIISIMLEFRPSEVMSLPVEKRPLSVFYAQVTLPLVFLYRDRPTITDWADTLRAGPLISNVISGACLGVRERQNVYTQFFYICPIKYFVSALQGSEVVRVPPADYDSYPVRRGGLVQGVEYVIEHDFSSAVELHESRITGQSFAALREGLVTYPLSICGVYWTVMFFALLYEIGLDTAIIPIPLPLGEVLGTVLGALLVIISFLGILIFTEEDHRLASHLQQIEFDAWYTYFHTLEVNPENSHFCIHFRPWITLGITGLGTLFLPLLIYRRPINFALFATLLLEIEVSHIALRWLLEIYSLTGTCKFTMFIRYIMVVSSQFMSNPATSAPSNQTLDVSTDSEDATDILTSGRRGKGPSRTNGVTDGPWNRSEIETFVPSAHRRESAV